MRARACRERRTDLLPVRRTQCHAGRDEREQAVDQRVVVPRRGTVTAGRALNRVGVGRRGRCRLGRLAARARVERVLPRHRQRRLAVLQLVVLRVLHGEGHGPACVGGHVERLGRLDGLAVHRLGDADLALIGRERDVPGSRRAVATDEAGAHVERLLAGRRAAVGDRHLGAGRADDDVTAAGDDDFQRQAAGRRTRVRDVEAGTGAAVGVDRDRRGVLTAACDLEQVGTCRVEAGATERCADQGRARLDAHRRCREATARVDRRRGARRARRGRRRRRRRAAGHSTRDGAGVRRSDSERERANDGQDASDEEGDHDAEQAPGSERRLLDALLARGDGHGETPF